LSSWPPEAGTDEQQRTLAEQPPHAAPAFHGSPSAAIVLKITAHVERHARRSPAGAY